MRKSSESTGTELAPLEAIGHLQQVPVPSVQDTQVAALETRLAEAEDARKEERFLWFMVCGLLFTVLSFMAAGGIAGTFVALVYLAMLIVLSKRWGFEGFVETLYEAKKFIEKHPSDD